MMKVSFKHRRQNNGFTLLEVVIVLAIVALLLSVIYSIAQGTLTFAPGITSQPANITVTADALDEAFERFAVNLTVPVNATVADAQGVVTIVNDDSLLPNISISNAPSILEANTPSTMTFTVSLGAVSTGTITVDYATAAATGTATSAAAFGSALTTLQAATTAWQERVFEPIKFDEPVQIVITVTAAATGVSGTPSAYAQATGVMVGITGG